jgi:hypothetical protein
MFSDRAKLIALAIVHVFETSKPLGDYTSVAVLDDGAGISYGINQFTHRSGSLFQVIEAYLARKPKANVDIITRALPLLKLTTYEAIRQCSINAALKSALSLAGDTREMQAAQREVMTERYLQPAIEACEGSNFTLPLSLAVIYDAKNHGSYEKIRDRVAIDRSEHPNAEDFEKSWINEYVHERDQWLASVPRLASTRYRTRLFINQIKLGNWNLDLPIRVQGVLLTDALLGINSAAAPVVKPTSEGTVSGAIPNDPLVPPEIEPPPTTSTPSVVVETEDKTPFLQKKWKQLSAAFTALGGTTGVTDAAAKSQALGLSAGFWEKVFYVVAIGIGVWLAYEIGHHFWDKYQKRKRTNLLVSVNSTPDNFVMLAKKEDLAAYEAAGWVVIRRG